MSWPLVAITIARQTFGRLVRSRMLLVLLAGIAVGTVFFFVMSPRFATRGGEPGAVIFGLIGYLMYLQFALPLAALYFGIVAVQGDLEDKTSVYLFSRPLPRSALLVGKWLAAAAIAGACVCLGLVLLRMGLARAGTLWRGGLPPPASMLWAFAHASGLGALAYAALGTLFGAWFRRPLIAGVAFLVGWEGAVANLAADASARAFTVTDPLRRLLWDAHDPKGEYASILRPGFLRDVDGRDLLDPSLAVLRFVVVALGLAIWIYSRREYDARTPD